ncbi:MAG: GC-type dockerin domain-anchored protein [Phycisphaerales bacterium]
MTTRVGLFDNPHTKLTGTVQQSWAIAMNDAGQATGYSSRWFGNVGLGESAWFFQPDGVGAGTSVRIGLFDNPEHTQTVGVTPGYQSANVWAISPAGHVIGQSTRYLGGTTGKGFTAWLFTPGPGGGSTVRVGLSGPGYVYTAGPSNGVETSRAEFVNSAGQAVGYTGHCDGALSLGNAAWYRQPSGATVRIGYVDAEHTMSTGQFPGLQTSDFNALSETGAAVGYSLRYTGASPRGQSLWYYTPEDGGTTTRLGFTGGQWVQSSGTEIGTQFSEFLAMNASGQVMGRSRGYAGAAWIITGGWVFTPGPSGGTTVRVGLLDGVHTQSSGPEISRQDTTPQFLNDAGDLAGISTRYSTTSANGRSAWFYRDGTTTRIGLFSAAYVDGNGSQYTNLVAMSNTGRVIGRSNLATGTGATPWMFEPTATGGDTFPIGPLVVPPGSTIRPALSVPVALNDSGQVIGTIDRSVGTTSFGTSGWFYDRATNTTMLLEFSVSTGGVSVTTPQFITPSGVVLGTYRLYSGATDLGDRTFRWSLTDGFQDLGGTAFAGLAANGWGSLRTVQSTSADGLRIAGSGLRTGQAAITNGAIYVLTPIAPCNLADVAQLGGQVGPDGQLTADDLIVFLSAFFAGNMSIADITGLGGASPPDGQLTADDVVSYIAAFFQGCS